MKGRENPKAKLIAGKYELLERAGEGGMAVVWRAVMHGAAGFSRPVALKQMKAELREEDRQVAMFVEEARLGSCLLHPNIIQVLDFVEDDQGSYWLVTEWVEGLDFGSLLRYYRSRHERIPWPLAALIGIGALRGLAAAHEIDVLPAHERHLRMAASGWRSPASRWLLLKVINILGAQGWYYQQMDRLADGLAPALDRGVLRSFARYCWDDLSRAVHLRR